MGLGGALLPYLGKMFTDNISWKEATAYSSYIIISYILGQGAVDAVKELQNGRGVANGTQKRG